jgi:hypothetical protein
VGSSGWHPVVVPLHALQTDTPYLHFCSSLIAVKCLFEAIDKLRTHEEIVAEPGKFIVAAPPGRLVRAPRGA